MQFEHINQPKAKQMFYKRAPIYTIYIVRQIHDSSHNSLFTAVKFKHDDVLPYDGGAFFVYSCAFCHLYISI